MRYLTVLSLLLLACDAANSQQPAGAGIDLVIDPAVGKAPETASTSIRARQ
jgi:hypothetical protein